MENPTVQRELYAVCSLEQAEKLVNYDQHRVWVNGDLAVILTEHWMQGEIAPDPLLLVAVFHDSAPQYPPAPPEVQAIIDLLTFVRNDF